MPDPDTDTVETRTTVITAFVLVCVAVAAMMASTARANSDLHHKVAGTGEPVVFLHGAGLDSRMWTHEFTHFAATHRVLRYDLRGFGQSPVPENSYSHIEDLRALLDRVEFDSAHLVGLSMGGGIALDFALEYPERVRSLTLAAPAVSGWQRPPEAGLPFRDIFLAAREGRTEDAIAGWMASPAVNLVDPGEHTVAQVRRMVSENIGFLTAPDAFQAVPVSRPAFERLEDLRVKTLVVIGDHDAEDLKRSAELIAERAPAARLERIRGAGHVSNLDAPDAFAALLKEFLSE